jgi:hypothetical protein
MTLPMNRKEANFSACVLPQIIVGNQFDQLHHFLKLIGVPDRFIKPQYLLGEIEFETEYCLKHSANTWQIGVSGETPDLLILLNVNGDRFLVCVETKMFSSVTSPQIRRQLDDQKKILRIIMERLSVSIGNFIHVVLLLQVPAGFSPQDDEVVIRWHDILQHYKHRKTDYFYQQLETASHRLDLISNATRKNSTGPGKYYNEIIEAFENTGDFFVGRQGNIRQVVQDCINGTIYRFKYSVNTDLKPGLDNPPGKTGMWWFKASDFIGVLQEHEIIS